MKRAFGITVLSLSLVSLGAGCATSQGRRGAADFSGVDLSSAREVVLTVHGLSCPLCASNLDGQLLRIAGVERVSLDLQTGTATARLREGHTVTAAALAEAVRQSGFTLQEIRITEANP